MSISNCYVLRYYLKRVFVLLLGFMGAIVGAVGPVYGKVVIATPDTYRALLSDLKPGYTLSLEAGVYEHGLSISDLHGEAGNPIIITGPETGDPAVFLGDRGITRNTVQITRASYLTIRHLKLDGLDVEYIDAVNARGITHHITLDRLEIVRHGAAQLTNGIATRGPAWDWIIRNCKIIGAGTGMYLGDSEGRRWPFVGGLIEHNLFVDTVGYNVQFKHMVSRFDSNGDPIPGMPLEDRKTIIRHNVFSKASQPSPPLEGPRPNLLVGHFPLSGPGSNDVYEIYGNLFYENTTEALFQGEGNIALYDNLFINSSGDAVNIQPHNDVPRNINVFHNTVVATGNGIGVWGADMNFTHRVAGNAIFAGKPISTSTSDPNNSAVVLRDNVTAAHASASDYLMNPEGDPGLGTLDLFPLAGKLLADSMDMTAFQGFSDWDLDFNQDPRDGTYRGAYAGEVNNNGWALAIDFKPSREVSLQAPSIISQPVPVTVQEGESATFSIVANGSASLSYQWRKGGDDIPGAIGSTYRIDSARLADNGAVYDCVVKNTVGEKTSVGVVLTVQGDSVAPEIVSASATSATVLAVMFSEPVEQSSAETVTNYSLDSDVVTAAVLDANARTVRLTVSELTEDTTYTLTVSNVTDQASTPNVIEPMSSLMFTYVSIEGFADGDAVGWEPLTASRWSVVMDEGDYAYFLNTTEYPSLSGDRLGEYSLLPGNYGDFTMTLQARLGDAVGSNAQADFAIVFGYQDANNYFYMMFNNNAAYTALFKVVNGARQQIAIAGQDWITDNFYHAVEISRNGGEITVLFDGATVLTATDTAFLTGRLGVGSFNDSAYFDDISVKESSPSVSQPPSITTQPAPITVQEGESATFSVVANGSAPLSYQWRKDGVVIPGATNPSYSTGPTGLADNDAVYDCVVTNTAGETVISEDAVLTVQGDAVDADAGGGGSFSPLFSLVFLLIIAGTVASRSVGQGRFYGRGQCRCGQ
ncbi:MAG: Ig-like domain-containing protein [Gammaproteobacteria bacterium]|nr:Ig-like domain-containing protein [Gammaproteobacteria bacterium]